MATEQVIEVPLRRYVIDSERSISAVLDGIFGGISQPDVPSLFAKLAASSSFEQFSTLVRQAQGSAGLLRFFQLELEKALTLDPEALGWNGRRFVRLITGNPLTMAKMTRHVAAAGSYAPVTILIEETTGGGTRVAYDSVASAISPYGSITASEVARQLDQEVLNLLRHATRAPSERETPKASESDK